MSVYAPGSLIGGRFEVASRPLMGGQGVVYLCTDTEGGRAVALKTWRPEFLPSRAARDRFLREGTHWVSLGAHPHIVRCYLAFHPSASIEVFLVLELVAREQGRPDASLRSWLTPGRPLPAETAMLFALQAARGLAHVADCIPGFVHRDLKPENLLVGADRLTHVSVNRLRVTDFGLARALEEAPTEALAASGEEFHPGRLRLTHGLAGTPLYMAPEQWLGRELGAWTDVYALGCILFEMLAGRCPVEGSTLETLSRAHCGGRLAPLPAGLPAAAVTLVRRFLAVDPEQRPRGWSEVEDELKDAYAAVSGRPGPTPEPPAILAREDRLAAGWSHSEMGAAYVELGQAREAISSFGQAVSAGRAEGDRRLEAAGLSQLGLAYAQLGETRRAIEHHQHALAIHREIGDRSGEGKTLGNLGIAYKNLGDARSAIDCQEQHLAIARETGDRSAEANALGNLGEAYRTLGDASRAMQYYEQSLAISREEGNPSGEATALGNLGSAYQQLGRPREALPYLEMALSIRRQIGDRQGESQDLGNLGNVHADLGDARRAVDYYEQALAIAREIGDCRGEAYVLANLGLLYGQLGDLARARHYWTQALPILEAIEDPTADRLRSMLRQITPR